MYVAFGKEKVILSKDIVAVFDLDITSQSHLTRKFLREADKAGTIENTADDLPKSFVVCREKEKNKVYLSQMATSTLVKRLQEKGTITYGRKFGKSDTGI